MDCYARCFDCGMQEHKVLAQGDNISFGGCPYCGGQAEALIGASRPAWYTGNRPPSPQAIKPQSNTSSSLIHVEGTVQNVRVTNSVLVGSKPRP